MWAEACDALARAERLQRQFFRPGQSSARPNWEPPVDIFETERELWIVAALPGIDAPAVELSVSDGVLSITGDRRASSPEGGIVHRIEIPQGRFERRIALPPGRYEIARRDLKDGCLTLVLLKNR